MCKPFYFTKLKEIRLKNIILLVIAGITIIYSLSFLFSIHFKVSYLFYWGPDLIRDFKKHKKEFQLLVNEIDRFVKDQTNFFEDFDGHCLYNDDGLVFYKVRLPYPKNKVLYQINLEEWQTVKYHYKIFPYDFHYGGIFIDQNYPNYVFFTSDERSARFLVYTRGGRPNKLINSYWEKYNFVRVRKIDHSWYDIVPTHYKN